jgi:hypothetical protein
MAFTNGNPGACDTGVRRQQFFGRNNAYANNTNRQHFQAVPTRLTFVGYIACRRHKASMPFVCAVWKLQRWSTAQ